MKILMVTSETVPFAKTGGLADAVSALAISLRKKGHDVRIIMPRYYKIDRSKLKAIDEPVAVVQIWYDDQMFEAFVLLGYVVVTGISEVLPGLVVA